MPMYSYECRVCGNIWRDEKTMAARYSVMCTGCQSVPQEKFPNPEDTSEMIPKVMMLMPQNVQFISDISHQDGRTGESVPQPGLGKDVHISSRRELNEVRKRVREKMFNDTDGDRRVLRPFRDPGTGKIVKDFVTHHNTGFDIGEIHTMDESRKTNEIMSAFDEGKTLAETERELKKDIIE